MRTTRAPCRRSWTFVGIVALPQAVQWSVDNFGMFLQMRVKFGPYPVIEVHWQPS
jgi:hypothetical protein